MCFWCFPSLLFTYLWALLAYVAPMWPPRRNFIHFFSILGALGTTWRHHWRPRGRLGRHFSLISMTFGWTLVQFLCEFRKNRTFCYFNALLQRNHYFWRSGRPSWSHSVHKVTPKMGQERPKQGSGWPRRCQVRSVMPICLSALRERLEIKRNPCRIKAKVYLSGQSYD